MAPWVRIRAFTADDYEGVVDVENRAFPGYGDSADEWRHADSHRDPKIIWGRYVAESEGRIVGSGGYSQSEGMYHPRKFQVSVTVDPDERRRGIGSLLAERVLGALDPREPIALFTYAREDQPESMAFAEGRGFREVMREWENHLDMGRFDRSRFAGTIDAVLESGIEIVTMADLASDPDRDRKLYELVEAVRADVPSPDETTAVDFDTWRRRLLESPRLLPDGYFVALDRGAYVGLSTLYSSQGSQDLHTGLTGTLRSHRRRGIALALKLAALDFAIARGTPRVRTWNATGNDGMLHINDRLGFERQPAWIEYVVEPGQGAGDSPS